MKNEELYWIWLSTIKGIGNTLMRRLLKAFSTPSVIYAASKKELMTVHGIGEITAETLVQGRSLAVAEKILGHMGKQNINLLTINDPYYPSHTRNLHQFPVLLYYKGTLTEESSGVAIVGARRCTSYGKRVTKEAAEFLASHNIPVISGMAKGIDGYAHTACIKAGGYTVAILGHGLDICYPQEHQDLMDAIIEHGVVISEYPPTTPVNRTNFPHRNYLISAWVETLLLVEAGGNSGALITAQYANELGKLVYAVPGSIYSRESSGTNHLLSNGAKVYLNPDQLLSSLKPNIRSSPPLLSSSPKKHLKINHTQKPSISHAPLETQILEILGDSNSTIDSLLRIFPNDPKKLLETLSIMELEGKVTRLPGGMITKTELLGSVPMTGFNVN